MGGPGSLLASKVFNKVDLRALCRPLDSTPNWNRKLPSLYCCKKGRSAQLSKMPLYAAVLAKIFTIPVGYCWSCLPVNNTPQYCTILLSFLWACIPCFPRSVSLELLCTRSAVACMGAHSEHTAIQCAGCMEGQWSPSFVIAPFVTSINSALHWKMLNSHTFGHV